MKLLSAGILFSLPYSVFSVPTQSTTPQCNDDVQVKVSISASNYDLLPQYNITSLVNGSLTDLDGLPRHQIAGTYTIGAQFCEPETVLDSRHDTLQILVHGFTYTRRYWTGLGESRDFDRKNYSWIGFASKQGYPTLAIDRICNGASSKLNGLTECQFPVNTEALNGVVEAARAGKIGNRRFSKIIIVSHSLGSLIANRLQATYPKAVDAYVMTGFTSHLLLSIPGDAEAARLVPAAIADPSRYAGNPDLSYVLVTNQPGIEGVFFFDKYSKAVAEYDYQARTTATIGEFATALLGQLQAPMYTGPVLVLNGQEDVVFCSNSPTDPIEGYKGDCLSGNSSYSARTKELYPNVTRFEWYQIANTGHCMNLHETAAETFTKAHDFLSSEGF